MAMVYSINDSTSIRWRGDQPEQVAAFKAKWETIVEHLDPNIEIKDEALKSILYEQMNNSLAFDSEVRHYLRAPEHKSYRF